MQKVGRNDPCPCGSGKKQKCHPGEYDKNAVLDRTLPDMPVTSCFIADDYDEMGISPIVVVRTNPETNRNIIASFMVDLFCLGVKDVLFEQEASERRLDLILESQPQWMVEIPYEQAREIVLGAVKYAASLGFEPYSGYHRAKAAIEPDKPFAYRPKDFGRNGRPFYYTGPNDDYARIFATLETNVGKGKFDYEIDERSGYWYEG